MKNLFPLVFLFPFAVSAGGEETFRVIEPYEQVRVLDRADLPSEEQLQLIRNCCVHAEEKSDRSIFSHKKRNWLRHLRETQRLQLSIFESEATLSARNSGDGAWHLGKVGKHGRVYGIEYRRTAGILDGSPRSLDFITRWFSSPNDP